jgi:transcriptional regulator with XRE-family HTH domain
MTNEELGRRIGVGHSMASRLRSGARAPGAQTMRRLSSELGIPIEELLAAHAEGSAATGKLIRKALSK